MHELSPGTIFAGLRVEEVVGRGGMGVVHRARQLDLDRTVALKVIAPELLEDLPMRERFLREARAAAAIDHPNVIPVFAAGEVDGIAYLTMRYVEGDDVRSLVRRTGALEGTRAARVVAQVGSALDAIHAAGFVHRDVKPANVLLGPGDHVYVTDFGLAKSALSQGGRTRTGQWVGTLDYVAPEQIRGEPADARADVYALGGVLHFMLTGRAPFPRDADEAKLWAHLHADPPQPSGAGVHPRFDAVVARAMAKDPDDRFPSAGDLGRAALAAAGGEPVLAPERTVARGSAAPGGAAAPTRAADDDTISATVRRDPRGGEAVTRRASGERGDDGSGASGGRRLGVAAAVMLAFALLIAGVAAVLLTGNGEETPPDEPEPDEAPRVAATIPRVGERPNGVAIVGDALWVTSFTSPRLRIVDRTDGSVEPGARVGVGASDIVVAGRDVWVASTRAGQVVRLAAHSGKRRQVIPMEKPAALAADGQSVWVASRTAVSGAPDQLVRLSRRTGEEKSRRAIPEGIATLALTAGSLWIGHRRIDRVSRLDLRTGEQELLSRDIGDGRLIDMAVGAGYVWVSSDEGIVARIRPRDRSVATIAAGGRAGQLAVADGRVWVALVDAGELAVIDIATGRPLDTELPVGLNPYGVAADERSVFVTSRADGTLTRIDH